MTNPVAHQGVFRCRIGVHNWVRVRREDRDLENPSAGAEWLTVCRSCGAERTNSIGFAVVLCAAVLVISIIVFWVTSPLLGAVLMIGALGGLMWAMLPASIERVTRWLSIGR